MHTHTHIHINPNKLQNSNTHNASGQAAAKLNRKFLGFQEYNCLSVFVEKKGASYVD